MLRSAFEVQTSASLYLHPDGEVMKEYEIRLARKDGVPINESVQHEISQIRDELGLTEYVFPWEK